MRAEQAKYTAVTHESAIQYFEKAIEEDPNYGPAYAALAEVYFNQTRGLNVIPDEVGMPQVEEMAIRALELDATLGEAHALLGNVQRLYHWDWVESEKEYKLALELDPNSETAHNGYASLLSVMSRDEEAITLSMRGQLLNPLNPETRYSSCRQLYYTRRYGEAIAQCQAALEMNQNYEPPQGYLGGIYEAQGRFKKAAKARQRSWILQGDSEEEVAGLTNAAASGAEDYWRWTLDFLTEKSKQKHVSPRRIAVIHGELGEMDQAFELLERAYEERDGVLVFLNEAPFFDPLRDDPRFQDLLRRMNLAP